MANFELHADLKRDGIIIGAFPLSLVLLINDSAYRWFVLVPQRHAVSDLIDLQEEDYRQFHDESRVFSLGIQQAFEGDKLNVAALGNMTPQLHVHHIVRLKTDPAWPKPIWGLQPLIPHKEGQVEAIVQKIEQANIPGLQLSCRP